MLPARTIDRNAFHIEFEDEFDATTLDESTWIPEYLPHWSTPDRTATRYEIRDGILRLRIDTDTPPWCPELDGDLRVSSLQTGVFAGPVGSSLGQLQFHEDVVVRTPQQSRALLMPRYGLIETRLRALDDPRMMAALWMIGLEDEPERSGEILVAEIFGRDAQPDRARIGMGVRRWADPTLTDDVVAAEVEVDVRDWHTYSADWTSESVAFYVDDRLIRFVEQSPSYPLQLMLANYEFPVDDDRRRPADYPKVVEVDWVRIWQRGR